MQIDSITASGALAPDLLSQLHAAGDSPAAQSKVVAEQFEAVMLRQFLDQSVGSMMGHGAGGDVYGSMLTDVMSQQLARGGGLGLASVLSQQFAPAGAAQPAAAATAAATYATGAAAGKGAP